VKDAPGRSRKSLLLVLLGIALFIVFGWADPARSDQKKGPASAPQPAGPPKTKSYTFGGLDIDGKLKTPQLLYFLNRMKSEFDSTVPDKRSFIPELKQSANEI
jgi:hypothetical protein